RPRRGHAQLLLELREWIDGHRPDGDVHLRGRRHLHHHLDGDRSAQWLSGAVRHRRRPGDRPVRNAPRRGEPGMLLVGLVAAAALLMIFSAVAVQNWTDVLRRDREAEMMSRAQEIVRAIRKYQRDKPGAPLIELKLLMEPGSKRQYFLRKLYTDPLVKDGK